MTNKIPNFLHYCINDNNGIAHNLSKIGRLFSIILIIISLVTAFSFLEIFSSKANIKYDIGVWSCHYNDIDILKDFAKYNLQLPLNLALKYRTSIIIPGPDSALIFDRFHPLADTFFMARDLAGTYKDLSQGIVFRFKENIRSPHFTGGLSVINTAFWEAEFKKILASNVDSLTYCKALAIILAHREIETRFFISNDGELPAKNIDVNLRTPMLIEPREFITHSRVELLDIKPNIFDISGNNIYRHISIPYMKPGQVEEFSITTSLTNITKENIFVSYDTEKILSANHIVKWLIVVTAIYILLAVLFTIYRYARIRIKMRKL